MTTNQINHQRTNTSNYTFTHRQTPPPPSSSSNILRHISTPSLEFFHNHSQAETMNLTRSSFARQNIRKKQPRTNPNYVNIQIKTTDGTLRSTYIRLNNAKKCQTFTFSSSSSSSPSSSETNSTQTTDRMIKPILPSTDGENPNNEYSPKKQTIFSV